MYLPKTFIDLRFAR